MTQIPKVQRNRSPDRALCICWWNMGWQWHRSYPRQQSSIERYLPWPSRQTTIQAKAHKKSRSAAAFSPPATKTEMQNVSDLWVPNLKHVHPLRLQWIILMTWNGQSTTGILMACSSHWSFGSFSWLVYAIDLPHSLVFLPCTSVGVFCLCLFISVLFL